MIILQILGTLFLVFLLFLSIRALLELSIIFGDGILAESLALFIFLLGTLFSMTVCSFLSWLIWR